MYPQADIPVVQLSLPSQQGPALQTRIGHALASLRAQGVLLIGSGSITHNLRELDWHAGPESVEPWAKAFRDWMIQHLAANDESALHAYRQQAPMPYAATQAMNTCYRCTSPEAPATRSAWSIKASPWVRWAWISIASIEQLAQQAKIPEPVGDFFA